LLLAIVAVFFFGWLGARGLDEPDEGRYAEIGREMVVTGSWWVPHLNGFEHFQKPPLLYWATALSLRVFGVNEWGARIPSALAALAVTALTMWIGRELFGRGAGLASGAVLFSSLGFFALARLLTPDMMLTFWITVAIACLVRNGREPHQRRWGWFFFTALGAGFLTKGPMALVVPISAALAWQGASRGQRPSLPWGRGLLLALAIGLSWFVGLSFWRRELFDYFWRYELVERFASSAHGRSKPFWFFAPVLVAALLPWAFFLPGLVRASWRRMQARSLGAPEWLLLGWVVPPLFIVSMSGSKLPTYILPLLPALALGLGHWLGRGAVAPSWVPRLALASAAIWLTGAAFLPRLNDRLGQQASLRDLIRPIATEPSAQKARFYAVEMRGHGLEFYLGRLVSVTREQADIVLPPTLEQQCRLLSTEGFREARILPKPGEPPVFAVVRRHRAAASFSPERWLTVGAAGDFILLRSQPVKLAIVDSIQ
jgi:4-amino-4-deoxy-L-arabinose transferase-like glycosyltransferase